MIALPAHFALPPIGTCPTGGTLHALRHDDGLHDEVDPITEAGAWRQERATDAAHRRLVALADSLKGIGADSYSSTSPRVLDLLVEAGATLQQRSHYGGLLVTTFAEHVVEGVTFKAAVMAYGERAA